MTRLAWDASGERFFEAGVNRGVLYLKDGRAVPWNGLREVSQENDDSASQSFQDGVPYVTIQSIGAFSGDLSAYTYPDEFEEVMGTATVRAGLLASGQPPKSFGLSYCTRVGNDIEGTEHAYQIHLLYNVSAVQGDVERVSYGSETEPVEFSWDIAAVPEPLQRYRPTAHAIFDSRYLSATFMKVVEDMLYGTDNWPPSLPSLETFVGLGLDEVMISITDNGDGTWTATGPPSFVYMTGLDTFQIDEVDALYLDDDTYVVSTTEY